MYYKTQVVAGTNYEIIIKVSDSATILVTLWEKLDRTIQVNSVEDKPAGYTGVETGGPDPVPVDNTIGTCNYIGADPCYSICEQPLTAAYLICNDYCQEVSELRSASNSVIKSSYQKCWDSSCSKLKDKAASGSATCQAKCRAQTSNMRISSKADNELYYNYCYKTNCEARYGANPDVDGSKVDESCKNACIGKEKQQKDAATYTAEYF